MSPPFGSWPPPSPPIASAVRNDSSVAGVSVKDALNNLLAAGSAPVTKVFGRIGDVVAAAGDYTSSLVSNLSTVSGATVTLALNALNAALISLQSTVAGLTSTSIANASTVSGSSVTAALNTLAGSSGAVRDPFWDPPTTPNADNDEFTSDTFASGAWNVIIGASNPGVRDGGVDMTITPAAGHYRSTCVGSTLLVQCRSADGLTAWKTIAAPFAVNQPELLWFAIGTVCGLGSTTANTETTATGDPSMGLSVWKNLAGSFDPNNRIGSAILTGSAGGNRLEIDGLIASSQTFNTQSMTGLPFGQDGLGVRLDIASSSSATGYGFSWRRDGTITRMLNLSSTLDFTTADCKIGFTARTGGVLAGAATPMSLWAISFFRRVRLSGGGWIGQA